MSDPTPGDIPEGFFSGGSHLTDKTLERLLNALANTATSHHEPIVAAGRATSSPGKGPQGIVFGSTLLLEMTPDTDDAFRQFKIPPSYVEAPSVHVHWTKSTDANENGKRSRWRISYAVFAGSGGFLGTPATIEYEAAYDDTGTTTRKIIRSPDLPLTGFVAGYYVGLKVESIAPTGGTPLSADPALFSVDLIYTQKINR